MRWTSAAEVTGGKIDVIKADEISDAVNRFVAVDFSKNAVRYERFTYVLVITLVAAKPTKPYFKAHLIEQNRITYVLNRSLTT